MTVSQMRTHALELLDTGLAAVDPVAAVTRALAVDNGALTWALNSEAPGRWHGAGTLRVVGMGKAAAAMAQGIEAVWPGARGLVVTKDGHSLPTDAIEVVEAAHPIPDERGVVAANRVEALLREMGPEDLTLVLVSGGGSALLPAPVEGVSLAEKQAITDELLRSGVDIVAVNRRRQALSRLKGGGMLRVAGGGTVVALILSDVIGDPLSIIASGPTVPPGTDHNPMAGTYHDVDYANLIVGSNRGCLEAMARRANELGYAPTVVTDRLSGEARVVGADLGNQLLGQVGQGGPRAVLFGGETTVTVAGDGRGGRNQELALAAAMTLVGNGRCVLLSAGTDGTDGPTDAAGGLVDGGTLGRGQAGGLDAAAFLARNDSYHYLQATGDLLKTGPTRTNVMDVQVLLST